MRVRPFVPGLLLLAAAHAQGTVPTPAATADLEVHEWGTFTSFQGSDGQVLEGLQHEEEPLPTFVHDLKNMVEIPAPPVGWGVKFPASHVTQKMETPVIYFHTDRPLRVWATVAFERGLLTQFYPMPTHLGPPLAELRAPVDMSKLQRSTAVWQVELVPPAAAAPAGVPPVDPAHPWAEARKVHAAWVRNVELPQRPHEVEQFVFYRGLGNFPMPVSVRSEANAARLHNGSAAALPFAAVLDVGDDGACWRPLGEVAVAADGVDLDLTGRSRRVLDDVVRELSDAVQKALEARGLFADEARAMVATWSRSWFRTPGSRVLYIVPSCEVERVLPLSVIAEPIAANTDPVVVFPPTSDGVLPDLGIPQPLPPRKTVRVLVGRIEFLTRAREREVEAALGRGEPPPVAARFREPVLRRMQQVCTDAEVKARLAALLASLPAR